MIDQNLLLLSVLPLAMIGIGAWALYLNRLTPEQIADRDRKTLAEAQETFREVEKLRERIERVEAEQRHDMRLVAHGRATRRPNHKVRPEAKAALSRAALSAAE